jgi:hypothetical protein
MRGQSVLEVDACEGRGELAEIGRGGPDQAGELAEAPVRRHDRRVGAGQHQPQALGVVAAGLHADRCALHPPGPAMVALSSPLAP